MIRSSVRSLPLVILVALVGSCAAFAQTFTQEQLIGDARQLAQIIEMSHPDPFVRCGGRIPFYLTLDGILNSIPTEGATRDDFIRLIRPLVAAVGDSHTEIWTDYSVSTFFPGGVPLSLGVVGLDLYVRGVIGDVPSELLGARLSSVEGIPLADLMRRQRTLCGLENDFDVLRELADRTLYYEPYLAELLPEWIDHGEIDFTVELPSGELQNHSVALAQPAYPATSVPSLVRLPSANDAGFYAGLWQPVPDSEEIGYILIEHQAGFREFLEENAAAGANETTPESRAHVPSATEEFRDLAIEMAQAGTETLVIDLRFDVGGTDTMADILVYFFYGWEGLRAYLGDRYIAGGFSAMRYSELHFANCSNQTIESVTATCEGVPFAVGEYDFGVGEGTREERAAAATAVDMPSYVGERYETASTFHEEVQSGAYAGYYTPPHVIVLVSPTTFSAGSTTMRALDLAGATLVGTPSGQSMKAFGNGTLWQLDHTGIRGLISRSYFDPYPDNPEKSEVWPLDIQVTYDDLASLAFDPNTELLLALEWIESQTDNEHPEVRP